MAENQKHPDRQHQDLGMKEGDPEGQEDKGGSKLS